MIDSAVPNAVAAHAASLLMPDDKLCFGVVCPGHSRCARYLAVDGVLGERRFIGTCEAQGDFPLFVDVTPPIAVGVNASIENRAAA